MKDGGNIENTQVEREGDDGGFGDNEDTSERKATKEAFETDPKAEYDWYDVTEDDSYGIDVSRYHFTPRGLGEYELPHNPTIEDAQKGPDKTKCSYWEAQHFSSAQRG